MGIDDEIEKRQRQLASQKSEYERIQARRKSEEEAAIRAFIAQFEEALAYLAARGHTMLPVVELDSGTLHSDPWIEKIHREKVLPIADVALYEGELVRAVVTTRHRGSLRSRMFGGIAKGQPVVQIYKSVEVGFGYPLGGATPETLEGAWRCLALCACQRMAHQCSS
ncbi:MAG: hypothetical protein QM695_04090 [Micropruina sp.]